MELCGPEFDISNPLDFKRHPPDGACLESLFARLAVDLQQLELLIDAYKKYVEDAEKALQNVIGIFMTDCNKELVGIMFLATESDVYSSGPAESH